MPDYDPVHGSPGHRNADHSGPRRRGRRAGLYRAVACRPDRPGGPAHGQDRRRVVSAKPGDGLVLAPEDEVLLRMALGKLDAKAGDGELEGAEVIRRLLSAIDKELMRWTSALVQAVGPSGDAVVAGFEPTGVV